MEPEQIVDNVTKAAMSGGGGFLSGILSAPGRLIKGALGSFWTGAWLSAGIAAVKVFLPQVWGAGLHAVGGDKMAAGAAREVHENGIPGVVKTSAIEGFGLAAAWGGITNALDGGAKNGTDSSAGWGTMLGTGAVIVAASAVAIGLHENGFKTAPAAHAGDPKLPPATPPVRPAVGNAKG